MKIKNERMYEFFSFVDMEIGATTYVDNDDSETSHIISSSSVSIKNRFRKFFGFPKVIDGKQTDDEQCSWCMCVQSISSNNISLFFLQLTIHFSVHVYS